LFIIAIELAMNWIRSIGHIRLFFGLLDGSHRSNHYQNFSRAAALAAGCGNLLG
jgi:hypothetical protein